MTADGTERPGDQPGESGHQRGRGPGRRHPDGHRTAGRGHSTGRGESDGHQTGGRGQAGGSQTGGRGSGPGPRPAGGRFERSPRPPRGWRPWLDPARETAYEAIAAVHRDDAYANLILPRMLRERGVAGRDAALATELTYGTLRMTGTLDAVVASAADRAVDRIDPPARDALRLGAYQLLYTRVPPHAATATTVDLVRALVPGAAGFANAVLRRIASRDLAAWLEELAPAYAEDPVGHLALVHAHPPWIVRAFADALGGAGNPAGLSAAAEALAADNVPALVQLCARPGRVDPDALAAEVGGERGRYGPYCVVLPGGAPGGVAALADGRAHVQDEGSQLVTAALVAAPLAARGPANRPEAGDPTVVPGAEGSGERWLDLCAGPGGKAALLGALAAQRGASVTAVEVVPHRARLVEQAVRGLPVQVITADGRDVGGHEALPEGGFDRVLVDAPCTGLGALRRRPEARWRRTPGDLPGLTRLQRELLGAAIRAARPGGAVGYVTCSPHLVETRVTVGEAVRRAPVPVAHLDVRELMPPDLPETGAGPAVQLWPHRHGTDAMYLAVLRRAD